jgi:predicted nucleic acid-binding protein
MAICFLDSSALVKRYVVETGSAWVKSQTDPTSGNQLYVARITGAEMIAAITRRQRRGAASPADASAAIAAFRADFAIAYFPLDVSEGLVAHAMDLAERHGLRGYDAVQLAAALELNARCLAAGAAPPLVVTADAELNRAAAAEGLAVDDPHAHP